MRYLLISLLAFSISGCLVSRSGSLKNTVVEVEQAVEAIDIDAFQNNGPEYFEAKAAHHEAEEKRNTVLADARRKADARARIETIKAIAFYLGAGAVGFGLLALAMVFVPYFATIRGLLLSIAIGCVSFGAASIAFSVYFFYVCLSGAALLVGFAGWFIFITVKKHQELEEKELENQKLDSVASEFARTAGEHIKSLPVVDRTERKRELRKRQRAAGIHDDIEEYLAPLRAETKAAKIVLEGLPK